MTALLTMHQLHGHGFGKMDQEQTNDRRTYAASGSTNQKLTAVPSRRNELFCPPTRNCNNKFQFSCSISWSTALISSPLNSTQFRYENQKQKTKNADAD